MFNLGAEERHDCLVAPACTLTEINCKLDVIMKDGRSEPKNQPSPACGHDAGGYSQAKSPLCFSPLTFGAVFIRRTQTGLGLFLFNKLWNTRSLVLPSVPWKLERFNICNGPRLWIIRLIVLSVRRPAWNDKFTTCTSDYCFPREVSIWISFADVWNLVTICLTSAFDIQAFLEKATLKVQGVLVNPTTGHLLYLYVIGIEKENYYNRASTKDTTNNKKIQRQERIVYTYISLLKTVKW